MSNAQGKIQGELWVADDDPDVRSAARMLLKRHFEAVQLFPEPQALQQALATNRPAAILLDLNYGHNQRGGEQGLHALRQIRSLDTDVAVVLMTAFGEVDLAVEAMKQGATDFVLKPWDNEKLLATLRTAASLCLARREAHELRTTNRELQAQLRGAPKTLVGSEGLKDALYRVQKAAPTQANVLILGENGTGKGVIARAIHDASKRSQGPFVSVDLGAISPQLFESELFGHEKGAFTGAIRARKGLFASANGGTIFLDEIGNLEPGLQSKLLTALEQRRVTPVGSDRSIELDVRVLAATNVEMDKLKDPKHFRQDLLFRLNTVEIHLPALRDRKGDIRELAWHFLKEFRVRYEKPELEFSNDALRQIEMHSWPGNVRALRHAIERGSIMAHDNKIEVADLDLSGPPAEHSQPAGEGEAPPLNLERLERQAIERAMREYKGNITKMAKALGLTRAALYRRLEKYEL